MLKEVKQNDTTTHRGPQKGKLEEEKEEIQLHMNLHVPIRYMNLQYKKARRSQVLGQIGLLPSKPSERIGKITL